jgi:hypothetical protein
LNKVFFLVVGFCFAALAFSDTGDDDSEALPFQGQSGPFLMSVFAEPGYLPAGHVKFDILVQDRNTQEIQLDATIDLTAVADAGTPRSFSTVGAVRKKSENKLMETAELNLPNEGNWRIRVAVKRDARVADFVLPLRVARQQTVPEHYISGAALRS